MKPWYQTDISVSELTALIESALAPVSGEVTTTDLMGLMGCTVLHRKALSHALVAVRNGKPALVTRYEGKGMFNNPLYMWHRA